MNKFNQIIIPAPVNLTDGIRNLLNVYSIKEIITYKDRPKDDKDLRDRAKSADCLLVSYDTTLTRDILANCKDLKYIGVCGTNLKNIDLDFASKHGITVTNVTDYGDESTAEYIFMLMLEFARHNAPFELFGKSIGLIGMGAVGTQMLRLAKGFNMGVYYTARTRKRNIESEHVKFVDLDFILENCKFISLHVPKDTMVLGSREFGLISPSSVLIDSCLGNVLNLEAFKKWILKGKNHAIFDQSPPFISNLKSLPNIIIGNQIAGITVDSKAKLSKKVLENIQKFLQTPPAHHTDRACSIRSFT